MEGDDSNRNKAKYRDGQKHFETLKSPSAEIKEPWRYHFFIIFSLRRTTTRAFFETSAEQNLYWLEVRLTVGHSGKGSGLATIGRRQRVKL